MANRPQGSRLGLLLLASLIYRVGVDNIPPVCLAVLGLNVFLFLSPVAPLMQTCVSVQQAYWYGDWNRLLLSPVHHADDLHLYFNMASFIVKGFALERRLGGPWFLYLLAVFSLLTGCVYLLLEAVLTELTDDPTYSLQCAVGFSGVLFALKVVNNHYHPGGVTRLMGLHVPNRYASWVELVLIHIMTPGTSFVGHLAGIIVGLLYTSGPLLTIMKTCANLATFGGFPSGPGQHFSTSGQSGFNAPDPDTGARTHPDSFEEEQLQAAIRNSLMDQGGPGHREPPAYGFHLPEERAVPKEPRWRRFMRSER
ncbi:rhomboid-related protein 4 isoform 1-T2 [Synchiropus picturatus]